jgi:hypothetical protein
MIKTNLKSVIARLEQYQAGIPGCVDRALAAEFWVPWLAKRARQVLEMQFALIDDVQTRERYRRLLPQIEHHISARVLPGHATFAFWLPSETISDVNLAAAAKYSALNWTPGGRARKYAMPDPLAELNLQAARQAILDWVTLEKQRDERDANLSNEQIAERIETILGLRPAMIERNAQMDAAAESLRGAIDAWLTGADNTHADGTGHDVTAPATDPTRNLPSLRGVSNGRARQWLEAVRETWLVNFRAVLRDRIRAELDKLHVKVQRAQQDFI